MHWAVEYTDEFGAWYQAVGAPVQDAIDRAVHLIEAWGPELPLPLSAGLSGARHPQMRELLVPSRGKRPVSIFYAVDPRSTVILLIGGRRTAAGRFQERMIPVAERLYDDYLNEIRRQGLIP
jgi:hypothetical protein